jgi:hypothetical protein
MTLIQELISLYVSGTVNITNKRRKNMEDTIDVASKLQRFMREQLKNLSTIVTSGGVDNMEDYKYILGQIRVYEFLLQEISNLLNNKELKEDAKGNVIKLD